jgi:hypothetical protein
MKSLLVCFLLLSASLLSAQNGPKCEASLHGFEISTVYVVGHQYNAVAWAYKHIAEATCLTPVLDPAKADAILDLEPATAGRANESSQEPLTVTCSSSSGSSICVDSDGNEMDTTCDRVGNCTSSYGPSLASGIGDLLRAWVESSWYAANAFLYTADHKLLWRSTDQKGDWLGAQWPDLVRLGTGSPTCKVGAWQRSSFKNYRHWASEHCSVQFAPFVSIDLRIKTKQKASAQQDREKQQMIDNAKDAAAKQKAMEE